MATGLPVHRDKAIDARLQPLQRPLELGDVVINDPADGVHRVEVIANASTVTQGHATVPWAQIGDQGADSASIGC
jgi:hypothetical protein